MKRTYQRISSRTATHWEKLDKAATGYAIKAATNYLEHAVARSKRLATDTTETFIEESLIIAEGLIEGKSNMSKKMAGQLERMAQVVAGIGVKINTAN